MSGSVVVEHLLLSILAWFAGLVTGGVLGYAFALLARRVWAARPDLRRPAVLLPWRPAVVTIVAVTLVYPSTAKVVGLGRTAGLLAVGVTIFALGLLQYRFLRS